MLVLVVFGAGYLWRFSVSQREAKADAALLELRAQPGVLDSEPKAADYLKVANAHSSTAAGRRARLLAAGAFFTEGRFSESMTEFQKVLDADSSGPLAAQAAFGLAASVDAQGKSEDAATRYREVITRFPDTSVAIQSRLALARIEEARQQPAAALRYYDEVLRDREGGPLVQQAVSQRETLVRKYPQIAGTNAVPSTVQP
jgi:TolA-binding protein